MRFLKVKNRLKHFFESLAAPLPILDAYANRWKLVIFGGCFSIVFINLFTPFNINTWYANSPLPQYLVLSSFGLVAMLTIAFSQFCLRPLFHFQTLTIQSFIHWSLIEFFLLSVVMYLIYGYEISISWAGLKSFISSARYTIMVSVLPYSMLVLYLLLRNQQHKMRMIAENDLKKNESSLLKDSLRLLDENNKFCLSLKLDALLLLKAEDNYVSVFYLADGKLKQSLIRTKLKKLESEVPSPPLLRTHRSYIVNLKQLNMVKKTAKGFSISLNSLSFFIPVSATYKRQFEQMV